MTEPAPPLRFLFDQHVSGPALRRLRVLGVDVIHASEAGLSDADDADIFLWAQAEGRIVVTRNYRDFAPLVGAYARRGEAFAGVLFYPGSVPEGDPEAHVRALMTWISAARDEGENPVRSTLGWLRAVPAEG